MGLQRKDSDDLPAKQSIEEIESIKPSADEIQSELSGIEATAASKAAWLISVVVSLGGFLFGSCPLRF